MKHLKQYLRNPQVLLNKKIDVLLTTYPSATTKNVGDDLITQSALKIIKTINPNYKPLILFRGESLDFIGQEKINSILCPGFSVKSGSYPNLFNLYSEIGGWVEKLYPVGCSFQHFTPSRNAYEVGMPDDQSLSFLRIVAKSRTIIPCRDYLIKEMLEEKGIPATYCGDLALYDPDNIGHAPKYPGKIRSIAVTVQHKTRYLKQSKLLLAELARLYPEASKYIVHHSIKTADSQKVSDHARSLGYKEVDLSGKAENLAFYNNIDIHVGYRLHGHIYFLRNRKPSILLIEDARSFGVANSGALNIGTFDAMTFCDGKLKVDLTAVEKITDFLHQQEVSGFSDYGKTFEFIDETYRNTAIPWFKSFIEDIGGALRDEG